MILLPTEFVERMKTLLGEEAEAFLQSYEKERAFGLRMNPIKTDGILLEKELPFHLSNVPWAKYGYYYNAEERPGRYSWHDAGVYYIQEPSAMAPAQMLDAKPGERVLDLCAAPGGKSTQIAGQMQGKGVLFSNEIHPERAKILSQNIERMGFGNVVVLNESPQTLQERFPLYFDRIMVDAPCSGEGMFRKDEEARNQWSESHVKQCAARQDEILSCAGAMLKPGGRIVYSTCTFAPEEDEGTIARFLYAHPEFETVHCENAYEGFSKGRKDWIGMDYPQGAQSVEETFRIWPHKMDGEGHYIAVLRKKAEVEKSEESGVSEEIGRSGRKRRKDGTKKNGQASHDKMSPDMWKTYQEFVLTMMETPDRWLEKERLLLFGEQLYQLPSNLSVDFNGLRVLRPGLHLGTFRKNRFEPSHAWALHLGAKDVKKSLSFPADSLPMQAYLRGETIQSENNTAKGWILICADMFSIGWAKASGGVLKNHYPKGLRHLGR